MNNAGIKWRVRVIASDGASRVAKAAFDTEDAAKLWVRDNPQVHGGTIMSEVIESYQEVEC